MNVEQFHAVTTVGDRKQLVDGAVVVNDPKLEHGVLQVRFAGALQAWLDAGPGRGLLSAPSDVVIDAHNVYGPDLLWVDEAHRPAELDRYLDRVPDLCVEIRSQSTWRYDVGAKKSGYEAAGLPELWLVDSVARTVLVFRRTRPETPRFDVALELARGDTLTSPQLPGFSLPLSALFRD